jgi:GT2 family glycosyltransferase
MPAVSIIIPAHNAAATLPATLSSLATERDLIGEILLVDDSSTDGTAEIALRCTEALDLPLKVLRVACLDSGQARNAGIEASEGQWLYFLDADDEHLNGGLRELLRIARTKPDIDIVIGAYRRITDGLVRRHKRPRSFSADGLSNAGAYVSGEHRSIAVGSILIRKDLVGAVRFPEGMLYDEDTVFWAQLLMRGRVATTSAITMVYRLATERANQRFLVDTHRRFVQWKRGLAILVDSGLPAHAIARRGGLVALKIARVHYASGDLKTATAFLTLAARHPLSPASRLRLWRYRAKLAIRSLGNSRSETGTPKDKPD